MRRLLATPTVGAKVQQIEADRHRFGWQTMHPTVQVVTVDGDRLRYQLLARPDGIAHGDPAPPTTRSPRTPRSRTDGRYPASRSP